jgi:HPr kinase/phosphorylase
MDTNNLPVSRQSHITVGRLLEGMRNDLELEVLGGYQGLGRRVLTPDVNRPGLALAGYLDFFSSDRLQMLGNTEIHFMRKQNTAELQHRLERLFSFEIPAFVISRGLEPLPILMDECNRRGIPLIRSTQSTGKIMSRTILFLSEEFSPETMVHATAVDCYGVGCLIVGTPGVGKSETALELVERGHRLIADDVVALKLKREHWLYAESSPVIEHHMEIRGIGIIDIKSVYGVGHVRNSKRIGLVVELEEWNPEGKYDRTGLSDEFVDILGVRVPRLVIPVRPGRNIAIILEVAALNHRLKEMGVNPAQALNERLMTMMSKSDD